MKFFLFLASVTAASAQLVCGPSGSFTIAGSTDVEIIAASWAQGYTAKCPGAKITVVGGGSSAGARRVCNEETAGTAVEIGNMSRDWNPISEANVTDAAKRKFVCNFGNKSRAVTQIDVAIDGIAVVVINAGLVAQCLRKLDGGGLSIDKLRWIYSDYTKAQLI